jgi:hypothetical protein
MVLQFNVLLLLDGKLKELQATASRHTILIFLFPTDARLCIIKVGHNIILSHSFLFIALK